MQRLSMPQPFLSFAAGKNMGQQNSPSNHLVKSQQVQQLEHLLDVATTRVKELERQVHLQKQENEDLRVNLKINKESLQSLLLEQKRPQEESALIRTINVISSENIKLQINLERMRLENEQLKSTIMTGRSIAGGAKAGVAVLHQAAGSTTLNQCKDS